MARDIKVRVAGTYRDVSNIWAKKNGVWYAVQSGWGHVGGSWQQWWPKEAGPTPGPNPGTYVLRPSSLYLPSANSGYAEFNTTAYRGGITSVKARISWTAASEPNSGVSSSGRPSGTFYRNVGNSGEWSGRTIDHDMYATAASQFNAGSAYGFTLSKLAVLNIAAQISYVQLVIVVS